jgi:hypothetical protein
MMYNSPAMVELQATEWSYMKKLNIVSLNCMVTIIGQIKPSGSLKTRTTWFIPHIEWVLWSSQEQTIFGEVGVYREMICDIAKGCVNHSSSACCHICKSGYTGSDGWKQHCNNSNNTLEY